VVVIGAVSRRSQIALCLAAGLGVAVCVFLSVFLVGEGLARASLWAGLASCPAALVSAVTSVWAAARLPEAPTPSSMPVAEGAVDRPEELDVVVRALLGRGRAGITTGLHGAGGVRKDNIGDDGVRGPTGSAPLRRASVPCHDWPGRAERDRDGEKGQ
jgi:hypothetical protein